MLCLVRSCFTLGYCYDFVVFSFMYLLLFFLFFFFVLCFYFIFFFFSSRRRHTRCLSDWSSDVCSSDLAMPFQLFSCPQPRRRLGQAVRLAQKLSYAGGLP